jgi:hypothetical protein
MTLRGRGFIDDTHEFKKKIFDADIGHKAHVERGVHQGKLMGRANRALGDIASFIKEDCDVPQLKEAIYLGSAAVHIYMLPTLQQAMFVSQVDPLGTTHEFTAAEALRQLRGDTQEYFGRKRQVKRSGT